MDNRLMAGALFMALTCASGAAMAAPMQVKLSFTITDEVSDSYDVFADAMVGDQMHQLHLAQCGSVGIDQLGDDTLVTPLICDGAKLSFALTETGISVLRDGAVESAFSLDPGPYFVNGLPLLVR